MTARTTAAELAVSRSGRYAYVFLVEGIPLAFTTSEDLTGVSGAWAATDWNASAVSWLPTAFLPGEWSQQIELFNPRVRADSCSFSVVDRRRYLAGLIFGGQAATARTFLTADLDNDDTAIAVQENAAFPASGDSYLYIGNETIRVDNTADKTATGWSDSERGQWALHTTESSAPFSTSHRRNVANGAAPKVTDRPTSWLNRRVAIYLHHYEAGSRTWSLASQALLVWDGFITNIADSGKASIIFNAVRSTAALSRQILEHQFTADVAEGRDIIEGRNRIVFVEAIDGSTPTLYSTDASAGWYSAERWHNALHIALAAAGLSYAWSFGRREDGRFTISAFSQPGDTPPANYRNSVFRVGMSDDAWDLLGFDTSGGQRTTVQEATGTYSVVYLDLAYAAGTDISPPVLYRRQAELLPLRYHFMQSSADLDPTASVRLTNVSGEFVTQPVITTSDPNPFGVDGYLKFGNIEIIGGQFTPSGADGTFRMTQKVRQQFSIGYEGVVGALKQGYSYRENDIERISVVQVWFEEAPVSDVFLRLLLSTGTSGFNSATYDVNPMGMAAAVPWSLLDVDSFKALGSDTWTLYVDKPRELARDLESMLATYNSYLVWKSGKIRLVSPRVDGPTIATTYTLTVDNKARKDDRIVAQLAPDGVINRVELKYDRTADGQFRSVTTIDDVVSQSDFPERTLEIESWGVQNRDHRGLPEVLRRLTAIVVAFFSRPMIVVERTITKAMIGAAPGDTVLLTDDYLIDPRTGEQGMDGYPAWVVAAKFSPEKSSGSVRLAYSGDFLVEKICQWAWSARVNDGASNGGYTVVDPSNRYIEVLPSQYRGAGQAADDTGVVAGDKIRIRELSPADPWSPLVFSATVASVDTALHRIYLTAALVGWDSGLRYVVTPDVIATATATQRLVNTWIADDADDSTGLLPNDSNIYGMPRFLAPSGAPTMTQGFVRPPRDGSVDAQGYPLAVGDVFEAMRSANVLLAYRTRHLAWSQVWTHAAGETISADKEMVAGPVWVPLYGRGLRNLLIRLYGQVDVAGTATFTITTSRQLPQGPAGVVVNFPDEAFAQRVTVATSSTSLEWLDEVEVACSPELGRIPPGVWLTIECETGDAGVVGKLRGVCVFEAAGT